MANSIYIRKSHLRLAPIVLAAAVTSGCVSTSALQDWNYHRVQKSRAAIAWHEEYDRDCRGSLGHDFEAGFKAGFVDASMGKNCDLPAVPPPKYWSASYQSCEAQECVQAWFRGYQAGQTAADERGLSNFHQVPVSPNAPVLNKTACGTCYARDACECNNSQPAAVMEYPAGIPAELPAVPVTP